MFCLCEVDEGIFSFEKDKWIKIYKEEFGKEFCLVIGWTEHKDSPKGGARIGIKNFNNNINIDLTTLKNVWNERDAESEYPFGWETLGKKDGYWWYWEYSDTLIDMKKGKILDYIKKELLEKELKGNLLETLYKLTHKNG